MENNEDLRYQKAKDAVKRIRGFYGHLAIFIAVMLIAVLAPLFNTRFCFICFSDNHWLNLLGFIPWGIGVFFHGLIALGRFKPFRNWEERKLREFMEMDEDL